MRAIKWIAIGAVLLIIVAVVVVSVIVSRYDFNKLKPVAADAVMDATGRELTMGDLSLALGFRPALVVEDVSFQNAPWGSRPEMVTVERFEIQVALLPLIGGDIAIRRLVLIKPDILIETDAAGNANFAFGEAAEEEPEETAPDEGMGELPRLEFNRVSIEDGQFTYRDGKADKTYDVALEDLTLVSTGTNRPADVNLKGSYDAKPFTIEGTVGSIPDLTDAGKPWELKLAISAGGAVINLDGEIKDAMKAKGIDLQVNAEGRSIPELAGLAGVSGIPDLGAFKATVNVSDPSADTYKLSDLAINLGENDLAGTAEIRLAGERPYLKAALTSEEIDLRPLLAKDEIEKQEAKPDVETEKKTGRVFPDEPLPLEALRLLDAQASVQAKSILLPRLALNDFTAEIALQDGALTVKPVKAIVGGGSFDARIDIREQGGVADLDIMTKVDELDLGSMLKQLDITDMIEGNLDAEIELSGRGESVAGIMAGLNGKTKTVMGSGRLHNTKGLGLFGTDLRSGLVRLINPFEKGEDYTEINCFVNGFEIKDGIAETKALVLDTSNLSIIGAGRIDLRTEALDISLKPSPKEGMGTGRTGKISISISELTKPFKLGGTLGNPRLAIDATQTALTVGKAAGGVALFGPVGIAAALASGSRGDENPCLAAIEAAEAGVEVPEADQAGEGEGLIEGAGRSLKGLFGGSSSKP